MKIRQKCHKKVKIGGKVRRLFHDTLGGTESDKNAHPNIQSKSAWVLLRGGIAVVGLPVIRQTVSRKGLTAHGLPVRLQGLS